MGRITELRNRVRGVMWDDIALCPCCMYAAEYAEDCHDCHKPEDILSRIDFTRFSLTNNCAEDCDHGFTWSPCDGCGETDGTRHPYVLWREPQFFRSNIGTIDFHIAIRAALAASVARARAARDAHRS